jgi:hypothetical protein
VVSTIVVFGSARVPAPEDAAGHLASAEADAAARPGDPAAARQLAAARRRVTYARYYEMARTFGSLVSSACQIGRTCDYVMITGGGPGIMEACNRGAADVGAKSIGLNIALPFEQRPNPDIHPGLCFNFHYFAMRKMHFLLRARALVFFPGGFGTLDEMFEALTLIQTEKVSALPVVLIGRRYWNGLLGWMRETMLAQRNVSDGDLDLFHVTDDLHEAAELIETCYRNHLSLGAGLEEVRRSRARRR